MDTMKTDLDSGNELTNRIERLQANCQSLTAMVRCMCTKCEAMTESDENFVSAHKTFCTPAMRSQFHQAGGASTQPQPRAIVTQTLPLPQYQSGARR
jgi:hypothetical protein